MSGFNAFDQEELMKLTGKAAIVTGAAQGIGKAIAIKYASEGASVIVNDINIEKANQVVKEIQDQGGIAVSSQASVLDRGEINNLVKNTVENFNGIHILVNNAIIRRIAPFMNLTEEDWDIGMGVGLKGVFICIQAVAGYMMEHRYGKIINIASVAGMDHGQPGMANYATVKGGVIQLTKVVARELGPYGINVNAIAPGRIMTGMTSIYRSKEEIERSMEQRKSVTVLGRIGEPEDVANVALFLASDDANFITGQAIRTDGGRIDGM